MKNNQFSKTSLILFFLNTFAISVLLAQDKISHLGKLDSDVDGGLVLAIKTQPKPSDAGLFKDVKGLKSIFFVAFVDRQFLEKLPKIDTVLDLQINSISEDAIPYLNAFPSVQTIEFLGEDEISGETIPELKKCEELSFDLHAITRKGVEHILDKMPSLKKLIIKNESNLTWSDFVFILGNRRWESLEVGEWVFVDHGVSGNSPD